jgi:kynureninase
MARHWLSSSLGPSIGERGQWLDIQQIMAVGKAAGSIVDWDCAHAAGKVRMTLHDWDVDFASWCTYKASHRLRQCMYLSSGPGSTTAIVVHEKHFDRPR